MFFLGVSNHWIPLASALPRLPEPPSLTLSASTGPKSDAPETEVPQVGSLGGGRTNYAKEIGKGCVYSLDIMGSFGEVEIS